jgi:cbb3-type cytochrome oxidase maturation protein
MWTIFLLIFLSLLLGLGVWFIFMWSVKSGQYDDPEGPKYRMLEDEDERSTEHHATEKTESTEGKHKS